MDELDGWAGAAALNLGDPADMRMVFESMLDPYIVLSAVRTDTGDIVDFRFDAANEAACAFHLKSRSELIGTRLLALHPAVATSGLLEAYREVVESGQPLVLDHWAYPQDVLGGEVRRYDVRAVKLGDGLGQTWRDVTERFEELQRLDAASQQFRILAENAADVVVHTRDGIALWISPSMFEELGWEPDELIGTNLRELIHPADQRLIAEARETTGPGESNRLRYRIRHADGRWVWVQVLTRLWVGDDGRVDGAVGTLRNIDAEVAANAELRRSQALYEGVFRAVGEGLMVLDAAGIVVQVNTSAERILGRSAAELVGSAFHADVWRAVDSEGDPMRVEDWPSDRALASGTPVRGRLLGLPGLGPGVRWVVMSAEPIDAASDQASVVVSVTDVTQLRKAEQDLAAEHDRLELVLASVGLGTWDWRLREDELGLDEGWGNLTGYSSDEVELMTMARWRALIHPEDQREVDAAAQRSITGAASVFDLEYRVRHRDGHWVWIRERGHVVERDESGIATHMMGTHEVIDELKAAQAAQRASEANFRVLAENASSIVTQTDRQGHLVWVSPSVRQLLGWDPEALQGLGLDDVAHPDDREVVHAAYEQVSGGVESSFEFRARTPDGRYRWFTVLLRPTFDKAGNINGRVAGWRDTDTEHRTREELARSRERLQYLASHDVLTGLLNRREFTAAAQAALTAGEHRAGLLFIDVDDFKPVNDTHGHAVGDAMLREIAERIAACSDGAPTARFGGDEFLMLLPDTRDEQALLAVAHRVQAATAEPTLVAGVRVSLSVSVGAAMSRPAETVDSLIARADAALYEAKRAGRGRAKLHDDLEMGRVDVP